MRYILDTHAFIWWDSTPNKIASTALSICQSPDNILLFSAASVWEMQIKIQLGKLELPGPLMDIIDNQIRTNQIELLPIELSHIYSLAGLPMHHRDPFDRMLIAQAVYEKIPIISVDKIMTQYPITVIWN